MVDINMLERHKFVDKRSKDKFVQKSRLKITDNSVSKGKFVGIKKNANS
jgi:hypothetical protein